MKLAHLRALLAIRRTGSLSGAARVVNLSHSALSVQMKQLENDLGGALFVPGRRPATLTPLGREVAREASGIVARLDALARLGEPDRVNGTVRLGFVPTTLQTLLPVALRRLRADFPGLAVKVRSALSARLAQDVAEGRLDFAFLTAPVAPQPGVALSEIGTEALELVMPSPREGSIAAILEAETYIGFSRETWLGAQIAQHLARAGWNGEPEIELDSVDAIEHLVAGGLGVSVVPRRLLAPASHARLTCRPLGDPAPLRRLMLASAPASNRPSVRATLEGIARP